MFCSHFVKLYILVVIFYDINGYDYEQQFRCKDGKFIPTWNFCNGFKNCADGSDEDYGCDRNTCGKGKFRCESGDCIPIVPSRCNGLRDCSDGSDEFHCDIQNHELSVENCTIQGQFLCGDGLRCLRWNETCNDIANCFDSSDENDNCFEYDVDMCSNCPHPCLRTPKGPRCFYNFNNGTAYSSYGTIEECNDFQNVCPQKCLMHEKKVQCSCSEHYTYDSALRGIPSTYHSAFSGILGTCLSHAPYGDVIIYSTSKRIVLSNISSLELLVHMSDFFAPMTPKPDFVVQDDVDATALTAAHNYAYWSVMSNSHASIFKKSLRNNHTDEPFFGNNENALMEYVFNHESGITSPITSISIDWMTSNVYFTSLKWLSVCSENIRLCTHLKNSTSGVESVALAPRYGFMFWVQNSKAGDFEARIFKSAMDGSDEHVLVNERLGFSNSLVVDEGSEKLYWLHVQLGRIESIQINGRGRKIERPDARNFFSFAEFESKLYGTLEFSNHIFSDLGRIFVTENSVVKHLYVYNPFLQRTKIISNPCLKSSCKGLCLIRPSLTTGLDYTCICEHSQPSAGIGGTRWCDSSRETAYEMRKSSPTRNILVFVVIFVIALLCIGFYFFSNWRRGIKMNDNLRLFNRKEENNDDL